jgi:hypothetical protein
MVSMQSIFIPFAFMTTKNHVKLGMMMAYQRNYTLRMNTVYKLMVIQGPAEIPDDFAKQL